MQYKRLLKLADLLEEDAKKKKGVKFTLGAWAAMDHNGKQSDFLAEDTKVEPSCGTYACALGFAAICGKFRGLSYILEEYGYLQDGHGNYVIKKGEAVPVFRLTPKYGNHEEFEAGQAYFELSEAEGVWLFDPWSYEKTEGAQAEREVVRRIRELVETKGLPLYAKVYMNLDEDDVYNLTDKQWDQIQKQGEKVGLKINEYNRRTY